MIGTPVFDDHGQRIATINDLLITDDGKVDKVVLSVRGRRQLVAVPFGQLRFVPSRNFGLLPERKRQFSQPSLDPVCLDLRKILQPVRRTVNLPL